MGSRTGFQNGNLWHWLSTKRSAFYAENMQVIRLECDDQVMYASFREFYPFYLGEHSDRRCRRLHFFGSWLVIASLVIAIATRNPWWLVGAPVCGYGCAWIGHFVFEKNKPATFRYPLYSLMGDWVMFAQALRGKITI